MNASNPWYVAVGDTSVGPVPGELVIRGIQQRKVPPEALVCEAGSTAWVPLASVEAFHAAVIQSYPPPPPGSEDALYWHAHGFHFPQPAAVPRFDESLYAARPSPSPHPPPAPIAAAAPRRTLPPLTPPPRRSAPSSAPPPSRVPPPPAPPPRRSAPPQLGALPAVAPPPPKRTLQPPSPPPAASPVAAPAHAAAPPPPAASPMRASASDIVVDLDIEEVLPSSSIDWTQRFQSYFLVDEEVSLPDQQALLASLSRVPRDTFQNDEALWNLALCMAYGSDALAEAAARTFWDVVAEQGNLDRLAWMDRALLGNGFVPSGIPSEAGRRAHERLKSVCPPALSQHPPAP